MVSFVPSVCLYTETWVNRWALTAREESQKPVRQCWCRMCSDISTQTAWVISTFFSLGAVVEDVCKRDLKRDELALWMLTPLAHSTGAEGSLSGCCWWVVHRLSGVVVFRTNWDFDFHAVLVADLTSGLQHERVAFHRYHLDKGFYLKTRSGCNYDNLADTAALPGQGFSPAVFQ